MVPADPRAGFGAPPRAWGGQVGDAVHVRLARSTPTCVGRTPGRLLALGSGAEHPHVRGEDRSNRSMNAARAGAPPRAWGGRQGRAPAHRRRRSTPTCVGRTSRRSHPPTANAEHPHVRGEDALQDLNGGRAAGAPPRAWGGQRALTGSGAEQRSTPTCVGRTLRQRRKAGAATEHPHVRGEDPTGHVTHDLLTGAPPGAWGGLHHPRLTEPARRSTPTCVGRTTEEPSPPTSTAEHPHVRGEDQRIGTDIDQRTGAPPRAWGGLVDDGTRERGFRSTPACVGRTTTSNASTVSASEHPHVRG